MLMILCFQGGGVFILKKDEDEEPIKVVKSSSCFHFFVSCLKMNTCMVVYNLIGNSC